MNYTLIFSKNSQIDNRNSPAGSDLTPMEYTLMMIVEEKGEGAIPGFTAGSTTIATNGEDRGLTNWRHQVTNCFSFCFPCRIVSVYKQRRKLLYSPSPLRHSQSFPIGIQFIIFKAV